MNYSFLDKEEYKDIPVVKIEDNMNDLPFFIMKSKECNQSKHRHKFIQIIYICKGKLKHVINNNIFDVYRGDIFIIPPFVPHYFIDEYHDNYEFIEFEFIPEFINEKFSLNEKGVGFMDFAYLEPFLVSENDIKPRLNLVGSPQIEVESILEEILREYAARNVDFELMIKALLLKILIIVGREFKMKIAGTEFQGLYDRHTDAIFNAIKFVDENYCNDITVEEAAKIAMLSQSYFRYLFKLIMHRTFTEYVRGMRIMKALELLKIRKDMRIIDICYNVGYNNISHFNRIFRQDIGASPSAFRKSFQ